MLLAQELYNKAQKIKLVLTDCDGVLTDNGVYYSSEGEYIKKFSIRDGMGVERLRLIGIETGIVTGELSKIVLKRAEKLNIKEVHLGIKDKATLIKALAQRKNLELCSIAYIGDDINDEEVFSLVGLTAAPQDATIFVQPLAHYHCKNKGGEGAFREFAEFIIRAQTYKKTL
ncbi:MAG: HAD-IIIA family hydrolase [Bacteroidia bacterium]|nr:HAD-IIIA family hydrolase [Bacteroidia bacterium]MDW8159581.1 HAD-IIIA family hydrolase [Bacteroidia bacterium]